MPKKDEHFVIEQVGRFYRSTCLRCLESSPLKKTRYQASRWQPLHARAELDDYDPVDVAREYASYGLYFDE